MGNSCVIKNNTTRLLIKPSFLNVKSLKDVLLSLFAWKRNVDESFDTGVDSLATNFTFLFT